MEKTLSKTTWEEKEQKAMKFMTERKETGSNKILIEVASQHPLKNGKFPNEEFTARLNKAIKIFRDLEKSRKIVEIFVPGSLHVDKGITDKTSLSKAGITFLQKNQIPPECLQGENLIEKYRGGKGVYNSADECFVAVEYFKEENFSELYCVCSAGQLHRKALHYIWFGLLPKFVSVSVANPHHSFVKEAIEHLPYVLWTDPSLKLLFLKERKPK